MVGRISGSSRTAPRTARSDSSLCGRLFCCGRVSIMKACEDWPSFSPMEREGASGDSRTFAILCLTDERLLSTGSEPIGPVGPGDRVQTQELERIRRYADPRSLLEAVSVGLLLLGKGLFILIPSDVLKVPLVLCMVASWIAWACFAPLYYSRKYGEVERKRSWPWPRLVGVSVIVALVFGSALVFSVGDARLSYLLWGSLMVCTWIWSESRRSQAYYLALGVLLLALALPGPSSAFLPQALATKGVAYTLSGTALILAGLLDHLQL